MRGGGYRESVFGSVREVTGEETVATRSGKRERAREEMREEGERAREEKRAKRPSPPAVAKVPHG